MAVCYSVVGLSGQCMELEMPLESKVGDMKRAIEDGWAVPQICQKLLCGGRLLPDSARCEALPEKELQLVVSTEMLRSALQSALAKEVLNQLQLVAQNCTYADHAVWSAVEAEVWDCLQIPPILGSDTQDARDAAAAVLLDGALASRPTTQKEALARLEGSCSRTRQVCVKMLAAFGDAEHVGHLRGRLEDMCPSVRLEAIKGLTKLIALDRPLLFAISGHLHDPSVAVRQTSVDAIGMYVSTSGCVACSQLQDAGECSNFADDFDFACMAVLSRLQHPQESVRSFVAAALAQAVACAVEPSCLRCRRPRCAIARQERTWAVQAAQALAPCLRDNASAVRGTALQVLVDLPGGGGVLGAPELLALKEKVFPCLFHSDAGVRIIASRVITRLVPRAGNKKEVQEVASALRALAKKDSDISVRTAAKNALPLIGEDPF